MLHLMFLGKNIIVNKTLKDTNSLTISRAKLFLRSM